MRYAVLIIAMLAIGCQVNLNLFPKFEGKKFNKDAKVAPAEWKVLAEAATEIAKEGTTPATSPVTSPVEPIDDSVYNLDLLHRPSPPACPHNIILFVRNKSGALCTCQECWEVFACDLK